MADLRIAELRALLAVVEGGSFAAAAERLSLTQSAISVQMKSLEAYAGVALFDRSVRPPRLTASGRTLAERARELLRLADDMTAGLGDDDRLVGRLDIGVVPGASLELVPDALAGLHAKWPEITVRVRSELSDALMQSVAHGGLDAAVVTEPRQLDVALSCRTLSDEALLVIAPPETAPTSDEKLLTTQPYIAFNRHSELGRIIDFGLGERGLAVTRTMELDSLDAIISMVMRGLGVAVVGERNVFPRYVGKLFTTPFGEPPLRRRIGFVRRARQPDTRLVDALATELQRVAATWCDPRST